MVITALRRVRDATLLPTAIYLSRTTSSTSSQSRDLLGRGATILHTMLRDRFSTHSTPSASPPPNGRTYSPAPPRTSSRLANPAQRPGLSRQSSAFSFANGSNTSLSSAARPPNGSPLKRSKEAPQDVPDPLQVLRSILGASPETRPSAVETGNNEKSNYVSDLVHDINFQDKSLQDFAELPLDDLTPDSDLADLGEAIPQCEIQI